MRLSRLGPLAAVVACLVLGALVFLASTVGLQALRSTGDRSEEPGSMPAMVYRAPDTVPTTDDYGPPGPVSVVFPGTDVRAGLTGKLAEPWIAISSRDGSYRALTAPHRPPARRDAVSVAPDGTMLAWAYDGGVVLVDTVTGTSRVVKGLAGTPYVGAFSPDGERLLVHDGAARVLGTADGDVLARLTGVRRDAASQAVWTPDGEALTYVDRRRLVRHSWSQDTREERPTRIATDATLAWSPSGELLAALRQTRRGRFVEVYDVAQRGAVVPTRRIERDQYSIQRLLGWTGEGGVAVTALQLESGPITSVYSMSVVDDRQPTSLTQLPTPGTNWVADEAFEVAAAPLVAGSEEFAEPQWPWSDLAKLVMSAVLAVFLLGLYLTRSPAARARWRARRIRRRERRLAG